MIRLDNSFNVTLADSRYLKLDQTNPQQIDNGTPRFNGGVSLVSVGSHVYKVTVTDDGAVLTEWLNPTGTPIGLLMGLTYA